MSRTSFAGALCAFLDSRSRKTTRRRSGFDLTRRRRGIRQGAESLEDRVMLTIDVSLDVGGNLLIADSGSSNDDLTLDYDGSASEFVISDAVNNLTTNIVGATGSGTTEIRVAVGLVTGSQILVQPGLGNDNVEVAPTYEIGSASSVVIDGGDGTDSVDWSTAAPVAAISIVSESTNLNSDATTVGHQSWLTAVTLSTDAVVTSTGSGNILFGTDLDGSHNITINTAGTTTIVNAGRTTALTSITTDAPGSTEGHQTITTTGSRRPRVRFVICC